MLIRRAMLNKKWIANLRLKIGWGNGQSQYLNLEKKYYAYHNFSYYNYTTSLIDMRFIYGMKNVINVHYLLNKYLIYK